MATTNFPNGVSSFGIPVLPILGDQPITGQVMFVDTVNGVNAGTGNGPNNPYQTIAYALTQVTSGAYATIYVMPLGGKDVKEVIEALNNYTETEPSTTSPPGEPIVLPD